MNRHSPGLLTWCESRCDVPARESQNADFDCAFPQVAGQQMRQLYIRSLHLFSLLRVWRCGTTCRENTRKNQVTSPVTLRQRATMSGALTPHEAVVEVEIAVAAWLEGAKASGRPVPEPSLRAARA